MGNYWSSSKSNDISKNLSDYERYIIKKNLWKACKENDLEAVKKLIAQGASLKLWNENGESAIHIAISNGNTEIAKLLIESGVDANELSKFGRYPLSYAFALDKEKGIDLVQFLIDKGAKVNLDKASYDKKKNSPLCSPLFFAVYRLNDRAVDLLIKSGADIDADTSDISMMNLHKNIFSCAIWRKKHDVIKILIDNAAPLLKQQLHDGVYLTEAAFTLGDYQTFKLILDECSVDVDMVRGTYIPLTAALMNNQVDKENAILLLKRGADLNKCNDQGKTALYFAAQTQKIEAIKLILNQRNDDVFKSYKADVNILPAGCETLMVFFQNNNDLHSEMRGLLRKAGCKEVPLKDSNIEKAIQNFMKSTQNTHDSDTTESIIRTIEKMRSLAGFSHTYIYAENEISNLKRKLQKEGKTDAEIDKQIAAKESEIYSNNIAFSEKREKLISENINEFLLKIQGAFDRANSALKEETAAGAESALKKTQEKQYEAAFNFISNTINENEYTMLDTDATNKEVYALLNAVSKNAYKDISDLKQKEEQINAVYEALLTELALRYTIYNEIAQRVCAHGMFNASVQAAAVLPDVLITAESIMQERSIDEQPNLDLNKIKKRAYQIIEGLDKKIHSALRDMIVTRVNEDDFNKYRAQLDDLKKFESYDEYSRDVTKQLDKFNLELRRVVKAGMEADDLSSYFANADSIRRNQIETIAFNAIDSIIEAHHSELLEVNHYKSALNALKEGVGIDKDLLSCVRPIINHYEQDITDGQNRLFEDEKLKLYDSKNVKNEHKLQQSINQIPPIDGNIQFRRMQLELALSEPEIAKMIANAKAPTMIKNDTVKRRINSAGESSKQAR